MASSPSKPSGPGTPVTRQASLASTSSLGKQRSSSWTAGPKMNTDVMKAIIHDDGVDRTEWQDNVLNSHPEIQELRERLYPVSRAVAFGQLYNIGRTEVKQSLSRQIILKLIMQHLQYEGLKQTKKALEEESRIKVTNVNLKESALLWYLREAIRDSEKVYDYVIDDMASHQNDIQQNEINDRKEELIEHLLAMGVDDDDEQEDVNIWEDQREHSVIFDETVGTPMDELREIRAASFNKLVERLTSEKSHDLKYMRTFLLTYRSFSKPDQLLLKLIQRYHVPKQREAVSDADEEEWRSTVVQPIQLRVCNVLKNWIDRHFDDFNDKLVMNLNMFIDNTLSQDGHGMLANHLRSVVEKKMAGDKDERKFMFSQPPPDPKVPKNIFAPSLKWYDVDEEEIARQLTLYDFSLYAAIKPSELLNQAWNKQKYKHRAYNVLTMIQRFNQISGWVASSIVKTDRLRNRAKIMSRFIEIARHLRTQNNYNTLMAVIAGLNNSAVHRLKHTKEEVPKKTLDTLDELAALMSRDHSCKRYREAIRNSNPPCIPYLGFYLTDLTFIEDGNPDMIQGLINFTKRKMVYNVILEIQQYQQRPYNLLRVHQIQVFLQRLPRVDEQEMYRLSLVREPRKAERSDLLL